MSATIFPTTSQHAASKSRCLKLLPMRKLRFIHTVSPSPTCREHNPFRNISPPSSLQYAKQLNEDHLNAYAHINDISFSFLVRNQLDLHFRYGGHGFTAMSPLLHASYDASLIPSAPHRLHRCHGLPASCYRRIFGSLSST